MAGARIPSETDVEESRRRPQKSGILTDAPSARPAARDNLMRATAIVLARHGWRGTTIARIAKEAGISTGAFYLSFRSRDEAVQQVYEEVQHRMLKEVAHAAASGATQLEKERLGIRRFFSFLQENPVFVPILLEVEALAPDLFTAQLGRTERAYVRSLKDARERDPLNLPDTDDGVALVAHVLMAARAFLGWRYFRDADRKPARGIESAYMRFLANGLCGGEGGGQ